MLRILKFNLIIDLPHKYLIFYLKSLNDWIDDTTTMEQLFSYSWSLLNDYVCYYNDIEKQKSNQIALAAIHLSIKYFRKKLKKLFQTSSMENQNQKYWYTNFDSELKKDTMESIIDEILKVFETISSK